MSLRRHPAGLAALPIGTTGRISAVALDGRHSRRLAELGIRTGTLVTVLGRTPGGGRVLGVGTSRLAVDGATATKLSAEPA